MAQISAPGLSSLTATPNTTTNSPISTVEQSFLTSYDGFADFPSNLGFKNSSKAIIDDYRLKFTTHYNHWLCPESDRDETAMIYVADLPENSTDWIKLVVKNETQLKEEMLGERPANGWRFQKRDPQCRFIFLGTNKTTRDPLVLTPKMLQRILTFHAVMPSVIDFLQVFHTETEEKPRDIRFSSFRDQDLTSKHQSTLMKLDRLGRSGRQFQVCYNLKSVEPLQSGWSVRQAAAYHQFDIENGNSLWMFAQGHWDLLEQVDAMTPRNWVPEDGGPKFDNLYNCFRSTFIIHQMFIEWSNRKWRAHLASIEDQVEKLSKLALSTVNKSWTIDDMVEAQRHEEDAKIVNMHLESNIQVLKSLQKFYQDLREKKDEELIKECSGDVLSFVRFLLAMINNLELEAKRAQLLIHLTTDRKVLITQRLQAQTTIKTERLNNSMFVFSYMAQRETIAMRAMAAVTIFYLPATFVSTFFSTDVIKYQNQPQPGESFDKNFMGTFSNIAIIRWVTISLPLTFITVVGCLTYYFRAQRKRESELAKYDLEKG